MMFRNAVVLSAFLILLVTACSLNKTDTLVTPTLDASLDSSIDGIGEQRVDPSQTPVIPFTIPPTVTLILTEPLIPTATQPPTITLTLTEPLIPTATQPLVTRAPEQDGLQGDLVLASANSSVSVGVESQPDLALNTDSNSL